MADVTNREINRDALAVRYALQCSIPHLRQAALEYVERVVRRHDGYIQQIVEQLGIDRKTFFRWRQDYPEIDRVWQEVVSKSAHN